MRREPIRIRLVPREPVSDQQNARDGFWRAIHLDDKEYQEIDLAERRLCRWFGYELRVLLISQLAEPINQYERMTDDGRLKDMERLILHFFDRQSSVEKDFGQTAQVLDSFIRLREQNHQFLRDRPNILRAHEKIAAAGLVNFNVTIAGYSSLNLYLLVGSLKTLSEVFDNDFDSFRVFLETFVPVAFGMVFSTKNADCVDFTVEIPISYEQGFTLAPSISTHLPATPSTQADSQPVSTTATRERAEWLWRLANGSLLVPFLLALLVMYQGMSILKDIRTLQYEAMKPILEHQLKLLEEDRRRLFNEPVPAQAISAAPSAPTK